MNTTTCHFTCLGCRVEKKFGTKLSVPSDWRMVNLSDSRSTKLVFFCPECQTSENFGKLATPEIPPDYTPLLEVKKTSCDGKDCLTFTEEVEGPPDRVKHGGLSYPWTKCSGGGPGKGSLPRHYCPNCMEALEPRQKPLAHGGPFESNPFRHVVVEEGGGGLDIGGILQIQ